LETKFCEPLGFVRKMEQKYLFYRSAVTFLQNLDSSGELTLGNQAHTRPTQTATSRHRRGYRGPGTRPPSGTEVHALHQAPGRQEKVSSQNSQHEHPFSVQAAHGKSDFIPSRT
jgi:hypothetical protein